MASIFDGPVNGSNPKITIRDTRDTAGRNSAVDAVPNAYESPVNQGEKKRQANPLVWPAGNAILESSNELRSTS
jgi:hypothetical protein